MSILSLIRRGAEDARLRAEVSRLHAEISRVEGERDHYLWLADHRWTLLRARDRDVERIARERDDLLGRMAEGRVA